MESFAALEPGDPLRVGPYRIVARLGGGGMGYVFLGQSRGGRAFAVKVIRPELARDDDFRRRFVREVASARRVNGVFTAGVVDADPEGSPPWLATAYVPGIPLDEAIVAHGPWPQEPTMALAAALAEALEAIHSVGVVHRDLKPSNVLLAADGPRVIDFGISLPQLSPVTSITGTGQAIGTPGFMSPEQLAGAVVGPASDVFSLGAVLALVASGSGPFGHGSIPEVMFRVAYHEPSLEGVPPRLRDVVARCLAKDPQQRPVVGALLNELAELAEVVSGGQDAAFTKGGWLPEAVARDVAARSTAPRLLADPPRTAAVPVHATRADPAGTAGEPSAAAIGAQAGVPDVPDQGTAALSRANDLWRHPTQTAGTPPGSSTAVAAPSHRSARRKRPQQRPQRALWVTAAVCAVLGIGVAVWLAVPFPKGGEHDDSSPPMKVVTSGPPAVSTPTASPSTSSSASPSPSASDRDRPKASAVPSRAAAGPPDGGSPEQAAAPSVQPSSPPAPTGLATSDFAAVANVTPSLTAQGTITWFAHSVTISGTFEPPFNRCAGVEFRVEGPNHEVKKTSRSACYKTTSFSFTVTLTGTPNGVAVTTYEEDVTQPWGGDWTARPPGI